MFLGTRIGLPMLAGGGAASLASLFPGTRVFHWDAQDSAMWQESAGGPTPADDATEPVGYIQDLSGNSRHGTQATAANRALVVVNGGKRMLRFDGSNDALSVTLPAVTGGTMIVAGQNGIWVESGVTNTSGAKTVGGSGWTIPGSAISRILQAVGDVIAIAYLTDTSLTSDQLASIRAVYVAKGSAGLYSEGSELVTNGDGSTTSGWTANNATLSSTGGQLRVTGTTGSGTVIAAYQDVTVVASAWYIARATATRRNTSAAGAQARVQDGFSGAILATIAAGTTVDAAVSGAIAVQAPDTGITMQNQLTTPNAVGAIGDFDNMSLKRLVAS